MATLTHLIKNHSERLLWMTLFTSLFAILGYFIPKTYFEFIDTRDYIEIKQPVSPEFTTYKRGQRIDLILNRRSFVNAEVTQSAKIVHVNGALVTRQLNDQQSPRRVLVENTRGEWVTIKTSGIYIPCDAIPGRSFVQALLTYEVNGVSRNYNYISSIFEISNEKELSCDE